MRRLTCLECTRPDLGRNSYCSCGRRLMPNSHRPPDTTQTGLYCRVSRCELSVPDRRTSAFCVRVRPAVALRRPTHSDTERTCLAVEPTHFHTSTPDTTKQSCPCRVRRGGVNWTVAINVIRLQIFCRLDSLELSGIQFTPPKRTRNRRPAEGRRLRWPESDCVCS